MAFFRRKTEKRDIPGEVHFDTALRAALLAETVTVKTAMEIPAVAGCVGLLAGTVASLPVRLYRTENGRSEEIADDYRLRLLNDETGDLLDAFQWKCTMVRDYLLSGNGYTFVNWQGKTIEGLYYIDPTYVSYQKSEDPIFKRVSYRINGVEYREFQMMRILRNSADGIIGYGVVADNPTQLDTMLSAMKYEGHIVKTGAKKGFLKAQRRLTQDIIDSLKRSWRQLYGNTSEETVVVLNDGIEFQDASQTAVDSQLNENKKTNNAEICRIFDVVPAVMEGGGSDEDLKNTVRFGLLPILRAFESAINRFCLLESEKAALKFEFDTDALDSTDLLARYQAYEVAVRNGWMQMDEVRYEEGRNPLGLTFVRLGLDTVLYDPKTGQLYTPNTKEWTDMLPGKEVKPNESGDQKSGAED